VFLMLQIAVFVGSSTAFETLLIDMLSRINGFKLSNVEDKDE